MYVIIVLCLINSGEMGKYIFAGMMYNLCKHILTIDLTRMINVLSYKTNASFMALINTM